MEVLIFLTTLDT